jgi:hypothetical protein
MSRRKAGLIVVVLTVVSGWAAAARADEPVLLKYKLARGDTLYYRSTFEMKQTQTLMSMKLQNEVKQNVITSRVIDSIDANGIATIRIKAERRKLTSDNGPLGKYEFDSQSTERDTGSTLGTSLTPILERLTGSEFQLLVSPRGEVKEVKGYAELIADLIKDNPFAAQFGGGDNKAAVQTEQESYVVLSEKPVSAGDKWEVPFETELPKIGKMKGKTVFTYEGPDKAGNLKTARIGLSTEVSFDLDIDQGGAKVTGSISTTNSSGTVQFDPAAGRVVSLKRATSMSGQLMVEAGGKMIPVDNEQDHSTTLELLEKLPE